MYRCCFLWISCQSVLPSFKTFFFNFNLMCYFFSSKRKCHTRLREADLFSRAPGRELLWEAGVLPSILCYCHFHGEVRILWINIMVKKFPQTVNWYSLLLLPSQKTELFLPSVIHQMECILKVIWSHQLHTGLKLPYLIHPVNIC